MLRRAFDASAAALGLVLLAPVFAAIAVAVRWDSDGPVFFRQTRIGRDGAPFRIVKFRTMRTDAEAVGGPLTVGRDPRVTRVGHALRASKLDELPQLWNVLVGDMALVGPRPEVPKYVEMYDERQRRVLSVRPGITDPASIRYRRESDVLANADDPEAAYVRTVMPEKLEINLAYLERRTFVSDIGVVFATFARLLGR